MDSSDISEDEDLRSTSVVPDPLRTTGEGPDNGSDGIGSSVGGTLSRVRGEDLREATLPILVTPRWVAHKSSA